MASDPDPSARPGRTTLVLAILCAAVFALGAFIGYHSVYREISVAALHHPAAAKPL